MVGKNAKGAAIGTPAKVPGISQPRIHHALQNRTDNDHFMIETQTPGCEEYLS
jgi:hypothetical protein